MGRSCKLATSIYTPHSPPHRQQSSVRIDVEKETETELAFIVPFRPLPLEEKPMRRIVARRGESIWLANSDVAKYCNLEASKAIWPAGTDHSAETAPSTAGLDPRTLYPSRLVGRWQVKRSGGDGRARRLFMHLLPGAHLAQSPPSPCHGREAAVAPSYASAGERPLPASQPHPCSPCSHLGRHGEEYIGTHRPRVVNPAHCPRHSSLLYAPVSPCSSIRALWV